MYVYVATKTAACDVRKDLLTDLVAKRFRQIPEQLYHHGCALPQVQQTMLR
jgi:hypothetical protein